MGVSVHFSGVVDRARISALRDELADISGSVGFDEPVMVDDLEKGLRGIILRPKSEMESIPFLFDSQGRLHSLGDLLAGWDDVTAILTVSVKTQFASCAEHIWLVELLRYVKRKYMPSLAVTDEGGYWESGDVEELKRRMALLDRMIDEFGSVLENAFMDSVVDRDDPQALADFVERVARAFRERDSG